jgi:hypothetical protein
VKTYNRGYGSVVKPEMKQIGLYGILYWVSALKLPEFNLVLHMFSITSTSQEAKIRFYRHLTKSHENKNKFRPYAFYFKRVSV